MLRGLKLGVVVAAGVAALLAAGCRGGSVLGRAPEGRPERVSAAKSAPAGASVVLAGTMVEKCPTAGCWFMLHDATGTVKVDTKNAGFAVVDVPVGARVTVEGRASGKAADRLIEATGVRY